MGKKKECSYLLEREDVKKLEILSPCNFLSFSPVVPPFLVIKFPITLLSSSILEYKTFQSISGLTGFYVLCKIYIL